MCEGGADFTRLVPQAPVFLGFGDLNQDELLGLAVHPQAAPFGKYYPHLLRMPLDLNNAAPLH